MSTQAEKLPYGVGRTSGGWLVAVLVLLVALAAGVYAYVTQVVQGEIVTGMRDIGTRGGVPWGIYVVFLIYFMGISFAGIAAAVVARLARIEALRPVARMAELLTLAALIAGILLVIADAGRPWRAIVNLLQYARPQSPMFGTFTLAVSGYFFAALVYFFLEARSDAAVLAERATRWRGLYRLAAAGYRGTPAERLRRRRTSFWLALAILPLLVSATSTLGFVFGLQVGRAGWFSALQAPGFVLLASASGTGVLIIIAAIVRRVVADGREKIPDATFQWLGKVLLVFTAIYLYFMAVEWLSAAYTGDAAEQVVQRAIFVGPYAPFYWTAVGLLLVTAIVILVQWLRRSYAVGALVLAGVLVNLAAIGKRYLIVVPSQTHGTLLPFKPGFYAPTWVEYLVVLGVAALAALLYLVLVRFVPVMKLDEGVSEHLRVEKHAQSPPTRPLRTFLTWMMVIVGFAVQAVSFLLLSAPMGRPVGPEFSSPRLPFAPTLFILGVLLVFLAAVVYELIPDRRETGT